MSLSMSCMSRLLLLDTERLEYGQQTPTLVHSMRTQCSSCWTTRGHWIYRQHIALPSRQLCVKASRCVHQ
eukprot:4676196-Amphidinium_carterae.1